MLMDALLWLLRNIDISHDNKLLNISFTTGICMWYQMMRQSQTFFLELLLQAPLQGKEVVFLSWPELKLVSQSVYFLCA